MRVRPVAATLVVVASLAAGGHAAASTREESRSDRAQPSPEQPVRPDPLVLRFAAEPLTPDQETKQAVLTEKDRRVQVWIAAVNAAKVQQYLAAVQAQAAERITKKSAVQTSRSAGAATDTGGRHFMCPQFASSANPAGDFAVPCYIVGRESGGSYTADNPHSSAGGAYQIMGMDPNTPPAEQDRVARGMALCNWSPPNYCAGN